MAYDPRLPGCFGERDLEFALHPLDEKRAFEWLIQLRRQGALWIQVREEIEEYLTQQGVKALEVDRQVSRARKMLGPWLPGPVGDEES